ncbi:MAG: EscU/YscU/HrcU family type III secretion system export apparatus switch protein, partial [Litorivicinus sp.]
RIREKAAEHGVARLETPPLARALYHSVEIDQEIPAGLYVAVAQVLAYVFQLNEYFKGRGQRPPHPSNLPIPSDLKVDPD